mmetsp:Transcript_2663/g.2538  ORF Transcript_2663/g.2538 Transcript_2663/m.2538 type:complete len:95 (-) Transcript_2663:255-539(-)
MCFILHLVACFWYLGASFSDFDDSSWVMEFGFKDSSNSEKYLVSIYWAYQTLTSVGCGDIRANSTLERFLALLWLMLSVSFYSFTIGNIQFIVN